MNYLIRQSRSVELKEYFKSLQIALYIAPNEKTDRLAKTMISVNLTTGKQIIQASAAFDVFFGLVLMVNQFE